MSSKRLVLFSGLGGDSRLTSPISVPGVSVVAPDHLEPGPGEDLPAYAARVADRHGVGPGDVVGGASFGGMIAAEIARQRPVAGLVLLGSCVHPERLPWTYRWVERIGRFIPDPVLRIRTWGPLLRWRFAPVTPEAVACLAAMARDCTPNQLRGFGRMLFGWKGIERFSCPVLSVHGDHDLIIPRACAEPGVVLKDAGHCFTLTHAAQTSAAVREFLTLT